MEARAAETDTGEQEIRYSAEPCRRGFGQILVAVYTDEAVAGRMPLLFKQPPETKPILTIADLRDEFEQFRMWASNIGVFASDHASLDLSILLKEDRQYVDEVPSELSDSDDASGSDSEPQTKHLTDLELLILEIENRLEHIPDVITKLIHLACVIRVSGVRSRRIKAATYHHDDEDGVNQSEIFEMTNLPSVLRSRYYVNESLLARLCKAISSRRRQFMCQQKHQKRLAYSGTTSNDSTLSAHSYYPLAPEQMGSFRNLSSSKAESPRRIVRQNGTHSAITGQTLATTFRGGALKRPVASTVVASTTKFMMSSVEFPPPPPILNRASHFQCPYCCLLMEERKREPTL
ncbi:uncharacterized protein Z519_08635 [Cladophialophora bantiana CBS 173.52]|uniref:Uncharacterized protein n=1 Tax=Cladophialophora bantiana (strain ATCC 10958 / CBS 173.52 / CDC B-1940 / NIH 8579) TaxID=1442370 RepID=A0A0D2FWE9_CLAB1|nr:uncharacterized protein Z519_08635 [Cladophialophora bantiana CBS 173.52]KIW90852.1 hypothetical protein Z519_08635 [Cladophialophora bantiana CBS 173.52]